MKKLNGYLRVSSKLIATAGVCAKNKSDTLYVNISDTSFTKKNR